MSERVLVTGGAGFIGSHTVDRLLELGAQVRVLDSLHPQVHRDGRPPAHLSSEAELVVADIRDLDAVRAAVRGIDRVAHFVAETSVGQSMYRSDHHVDVNVRGVAVLFRALREEGVDAGRVVVSSSRAVYGEGAQRCPRHGVAYPGPRDVHDLEAGAWTHRCPVCGAPAEAVPTTEDAPYGWASAYGMTKAFQEQVAVAEAEQLGIPLVVLRYFNVYGPRQSLDNPYTGLIGTFALRLLGGKPLVLYEGGTPIRDFVHVDDVVDATVAALVGALPAERVLNVGTGVGVSLSELAQAIGRAFGREPAVEPAPRFRVGDVHAAIADLSRTTRVLGWAPRVPLAEGLATLVELVESAKAPDRSDEVEQEMRAMGVLRG
ncbi:MAG TPA: SDR family NAD(P)-dependent oxidoreductase [Solirubrobacteraceae bacterium]|nr:SDR family NAD(P)-dependent oxidoreductase [Solirubrobacteraceae bacterium]